MNRRGIPQGHAFRESGDPCPLEWRGSLDAALAISTSASPTRTIRATPRPARSSFIPAAISETEILLAYGGRGISRARWASLPAITSSPLTSGLENLTAFGKTVLWKGAQKKSASKEV